MIIWIKNHIKKLLGDFYLSNNNELNKENKKPDVDSAHIQSPYDSPEENPEYVKEYNPVIPDTTLKPMAFYLPQYYPFKENNEFWGKGFTDWHNVSRALPLYNGHYQPKLPGELGFYDLRLSDVLRKQSHLAKQYGIYGFCFHHYYFRDRSIMCKPLNLLLENKDIDMPFCLNWANEPWTVRWDGDREKGGILLDQKHDDKENTGFINDALKAFEDSRYIKIENKPVLLIYRPGLFPDFKRTAESWRKFLIQNGFNGLYLVMVQTFFDKTKDPENYGCDAAVEFPPHQGFCVPKKPENTFYTSSFNGSIIDYQKLAAFSMQKKKPSYTFFRGIMPGWDNTARTKNAKIYYGSSPAIYRKWLTQISRHTLKDLPNDRQFIFINAWNEWAESAYLEPDRKYGHAYLSATAAALIDVTKR